MNKKHINIKDYYSVSERIVRVIMSCTEEKQLNMVYDYVSLLINIFYKRNKSTNVLELIDTYNRCMNEHCKEKKWHPKLF